jgi:hypothetical protein
VTGFFVAAAGFGPVQLVELIIGCGGLITAGVAIYKVRPDVDTAAVIRSQGAVETMALLQRELEKDRDAWRVRAVGCEQELHRVQAELDACQQAHARRSRDRG